MGGGSVRIHITSTISTASVTVSVTVSVTNVVSERPFGPVRLVIGDIRGASRPFVGVVVGEESLDWYHKHNLHGLGHGLGHGQGCRFRMGPPTPAHRDCFRSGNRPVHHQGLLGLKPRTSVLPLQSVCQSSPKGNGNLTARDVPKWTKLINMLCSQ